MAPLLALLLLAGGCDYLPPMPQNPFRVTPTVVEEPTATPIVAASPTPFPTPTQPTFTSFWVKNHRPTEMWSGPPGQPGVISFGTTSSQFCSFQVMEPQTSGRLHVLNPYSKDYFWIDADAVGPVAEPPQRMAGPDPLAHARGADARGPDMKRPAVRAGREWGK
jgi:hypothetical protein